MKRLVRWAAVCVLFVGLQLAFTLWYLVPYIAGRHYSIFWESDSSDFGWQPLTPYYAWPILLAYGGALLVVAITVAVAIGRSIFLRERQAIAQREAAVELQEEQARHTMAEAERIKQTARNQVQAAMEEVARREQTAAVQIEDANTRLQGSVDTNMGRQKQIQKLRARVTELEQQVTMGHC